MEEQDLVLDFYGLLMERTVIADSEALATAMNFWGSLAVDVSFPDEAGNYPV